VPPATEILQGAWWEDKPESPLVSVNDTVAESLNIRIGSLITWRTASGTVEARVANLRRTDGVRAGGNNQFILSPGALDGFATAYVGSVRVKPGGIGPLQLRVFEQYPTVTVVNAADILEVVQDVIDKTSQAVRFVAGFAIFGGLIVLASSVAGTRYRRARESAIFKTVGATRGTLIRIFSAEFAVIGTAAGLIGSVLATVLSSILVGQLLDAPYHFRWLPSVVATITTALLTVLAGWLASHGVMRKKPLEILREIE
jgi:putative ABC transport system permease protein